MNGVTVFIDGVGARIATGIDALTTTMSVRARKSFVRESRFIDRAGEAIALSTVSSIADDLVGRERFLTLGASALAEAAGPARTGRAIPLVLAVPSEADPFDPRGARLLEALANGSGVPLDLARSKVLAQGRAGGAAAIELAVQRLAAGEEAILVGGVDSYFDPDRLEALDKDLRLHAAGTENGFIPGEGSAFLRLSRGGAAPCYASIRGVATEREPRPYGASEPCHALGISLAVKRALGTAHIVWCLSDVLGERHRVEEWLYALGRIQSSCSPDLVHHTPLEITGDLGAASVPLLAVLACMGWHTESAPPDATLALIAGHSDGVERGAVLLASPGSARA